MKKSRLKATDVDPAELEMGRAIEMEHTDDPEVALQIALHHLDEDPRYYTKISRALGNPPPGLTAKGKRMYDEVKKSGSAEAPAAVVYAAAKKGAPGLVTRKWAKEHGYPIPNKQPQDLDRAILLYEEFQDFSPSEVGAFPSSVKIPESCYRVGKGIHISYHSKKWRDPADYIHRFERGVNVHLLTDEQGGRLVRVPDYVRNVESLTRLGWLIDCRWEDRGGEEFEAQAKNPRPELYAIPSGRALVVVEKKKEVVMLIWGGRLNVEDRGIVH